MNATTHPHHLSTSRFRWLAALTVLLLALTACTSDDTADETPETNAEESADTTADESSGPAPAEPDGGEVVSITAADYAFEGVPETVSVGTELTLQGADGAEPHEAIVFQLADGDTRTPTEVLEEGTDERVAGVLIAPPGGAPGIAPAGPVVLDEPGRYMLVCFIPSGTTPEAFGEIAASGGTSEDLPETGPPHFLQGMVAELTVEA